MKKGWEEKAVGDILQLEYGKPLDETDRKPDGRYPAYGANGEKDRTDKFYHDKPSIIVGRKGSAGEINLTEQKFWPLDVTYFVTFDESQHDLRFLYYLLTTLELTKLAKGVKPGINRNEVYSQATRVPPLAEQQRIVGVLDRAFEGLAVAAANAEKNLKNARELFESHLSDVFTRRGEGWVDAGRSLEELCEMIVDCEHKTAPTQDLGIPSVRTPNIGRGKLLLEGVNRVSEATYKQWTKRAEPRGGDLILAREAPAGNVAVIPLGTRLCLGQRTVLIRPRSDVFNPSFLAFLLLERGTQARLLAHSRGATVKHVNLKDIRALQVGAVPCVSLQERIAELLQSLDTHAARLCGIYEQKQAALAALKRSLLHQALNGEL